MLIEIQLLLTRALKKAENNIERAESLFIKTESFPMLEHVVL